MAIFDKDNFVYILLYSSCVEKLLSYQTILIFIFLELFIEFIKKLFNLYLNLITRTKLIGVNSLVINIQCIIEAVMQVPIIYSTGPNGKHVFNSLYVSNYKRLD